MTRAALISVTAETARTHPHTPDLLAPTRGPRC